jgi:hypothetical protein
MMYISLGALRHCFFVSIVIVSRIREWGLNKHSPLYTNTCNHQFQWPLRLEFVKWGGQRERVVWTLDIAGTAFDIQLSYLVLTWID